MAVRAHDRSTIGSEGVTHRARVRHTRYLAGPMSRISSRALVAVVLFGCSADQTAILLELEAAELVVPTDLDQVRVLATGESGVMADVTLDLPGTWPETFAIRPGAGRGDELVSLRVSGLAGGRERYRRVLAPVRFQSGRITRVTVVFTRDCLDVICASSDVGCVAGSCAGGEPPDGGVDGGVPGDAGVDGGTPEDAGVDGGAPEDAGVDGGAPEDAGVDGGRVDGGTDSGTDAGPPGERRLLFTEYVEGTSSNKALEVTNLGATEVSLAGCEIDLYSNGSVTASASGGIMLSGTLAPGASIVACYGGSSTAVASFCTPGLISNAGGFNGNDALALNCGGDPVDIFGSIGPTHAVTRAWGTPPTSTEDATLRRACAVTTGDTNGDDAFDPSLEWEGFPTDTFDDLGAYDCP